jgi:predicted ribonuclease YlaK
MRLKNISSYQEIRAYIANKLALPLVVLESLEKGKKVNNTTIATARNELKKIIVYLDKKWTLKKRSKK